MFSISSRHMLRFKYIPQNMIRCNGYKSTRKTVSSQHQQHQQFHIDKKKKSSEFLLKKKESKKVDYLFSSLKKRQCVSQVWNNSSFFQPRNTKQQEYYDLLKNNESEIVIAIGPAGTSKTMCATLVGIEKLMKKEISRLVLTRPAVSADEELGFLKGDLEDKMKPWLLPIYDTLNMYMTHEEIDDLMESSQIEICSLSHMRGRTFRDCFVIIDESQNTTPSQMLMLLTRIGENSKFVFTGDLQQHDRVSVRGSNQIISGLQDFVDRMNKRECEKALEAYHGNDDHSSTYFTSSSNKNLNKNKQDYVKLFTFDHSHIERHHAIPYVIDLYKET